MKVCVTGATGFVGAHVARAAAARGDEVRVVYRNPDRLDALKGFRYRRAKADVLDLATMRRAVRGAEVIFHTAGFVGSSPRKRVWEMNAKAPRVVVEAAAAEGVRRVVVTSSVSAIGPADGEESGDADEDTDYPDEGLELEYADSKHTGEDEAFEAGAGFGVEVVVVNPAYVLGVPVDPSLPGETSTRIIGNYLRGRLPAVIDAPQNFVDVEDAAIGHLLAGDRGRPGERYILGAENMTWVEMIERVARISDVHEPLLVLPRDVAKLAVARQKVRLPGLLDPQGYLLMAQEWRFDDAKAREELGYTSRPLEETLRATIDWYRALIEDGAFADGGSSGLSRASAALRLGERAGLLAGLRFAGRRLGRQFVARG